MRHDSFGSREISRTERWPMSAGSLAAVPAFLRDLAAALPVTLTLSEGAGVLRCSERHLRQLIADGAIKAHRSSLTGSARLVITRAELVRHIAEHSAR